MTLTLPESDPLAIAATQAIQQGDVVALQRMLNDDSSLATARLSRPCKGRDAVMTRTLLHVVTDWPGHFPNGAATVAALVTAGADVNGRCEGGPHTETPLHWAASSDDVAVLDALLDAGADIEARGAVIAGGTPLSDAAAFGQWKTARRLLERGAASSFWESSVLGLMDRVEGYIAGGASPTAEEINKAFWGACHGGQRVAAEYLLGRGADINWVGWDQLTPVDAARRCEAHELAEWLVSRGAKSATELRS